MVIIPIYNILMLPDTKIYLGKDYLDSVGVSELNVDDKVVFLLGRDEEEAPGNSPEHYFPVGVAGHVMNIDKDGGVSIETGNRINIEQVDFETQNVYAVNRPDVQDLSQEQAAEQVSRLRTAILKFIRQFQWGPAARGYIMRWKTMNDMAVGMSPFLDLTNEERYQILETDSVAQRAELIEKSIMEYMALSEVAEEAKDSQKEASDRLYREDAIRKQMSFLQKELDKLHPENQTDVQKFQEKIDQSGMNETARMEAQKVLNRMKQEGRDGHEYGMLYDYLEFVTGLSWKKEPMEKVDLKKAEAVLERDHYGLKKVKRRILEQLAVMALNNKQSGSILLFTGAPGTGKTSIGRSIAQALGRKYVRISLGGIRDEAEIRGHRRTYVGAMPGRIMDGIKRTGVSNPVVVLDEIDKVTAGGFSGDPASALLEVLDPEQNSTFTDHYMNVPYDLSDVLFICTANSTDTIPAPLLDRMEIVSFTGYSPLEKFHIAKKHLLPDAREKTGISAGSLRVNDEAIRIIIEQYTMEAGVRGLKKQMETLCRHAAVQIVGGNSKRVTVTPKKLPEFLDQTPILHEHVQEVKAPGIVTGLAWTSAGGEILFIETMMTKGDGKLKITGQLGDVMKESVQIAVSLVKKMYPDKSEIFEQNDFHIHVPAGAVPKDGPSAGITLTTALASLVTGIPVAPRFAMTGEVSLRGNVMPIGGLPEKLMAAQRAGVKTVFIPQENKDSLKDVPAEVLQELEIIPVKKVTDVLERVLV